MSDVSGRFVLAAVVFAAVSLAAAAAAHDYGDALHKSLLYFEAQRSGRLPYNQRVRWRGHSGLTDGLEQGVDLVGGYYDAGDHVKFGLPMAFTVTLLSWGVLEYGAGVSAAGELPHALQAIKWGTDYFVKAHTAAHELWTQVGDGDSDHYCWQRPEDMTTSRRAYKVDAGNPGSEVAAETAAAMAAASVVFLRAGDAHYAHVLLHHAQQLFEFADTFRGRYDESVEVVKNYYPSSSGYHDELLWAALWLHRATGRREYLDYVIANADEFGGTGWAVSEFSWDIKYAGLQVLASQLLVEAKERRLHLSASERAVVEQLRSKGEYYVCSCMNRNPGGAEHNAGRTPAGLIFIRPWNNLQYASGAAFLLTVYSDVLSSLGEPLRCGGDGDAAAGDAGEVLAFAKSQADYILGSNPMRTSYLVGYGGAYPRRVHHRAASSASYRHDRDFIGCLQGFDSWYSARGENPHDLVGAVVGGPNGEDVFNDHRGFISIDCGIPGNSSYQDLTSSIIYVSDHGFISSGEKHNISADYIRPSLAPRYYNVRFFPDGKRNCYTLRSLVAGNKYFVRAAFYYGNYDGLNKLPVFDLYLGANYWHEVKFRGANAVNWMDIVVVAPADYLQVCLVNKGMGTPFISGLDLRPLKSTLYPEANASQSLVLIDSNRFNLGPTDDSIVRYPLDPHDRIWLTYDTIPSWKETSATSVVSNYLTDAYDVPSAVMQNAATPVNGSRIDFSWNPSDPSVNISSRYFFVFYFAELESVAIASNELRQFDIIVDKSTWNTKPYTPRYLFADSFSGTVHGKTSYSISLVASKNATLPPILNAMEMYLVKPISETATDPGDARAMMAIQETFKVNKNWMGDPCAPKAFAWEGLNCTYLLGGLPRIIALNLSSSGLAGSIPTYFGDMKALQYLDLSHNNLSGSVSNYLGQLPSLVFLDLSSNDLSGPIPYSLLQKSQNGTLSLRLGHNANLCGNGTTCGSDRKKMNGAVLSAIIIPTMATIALFVILTVLLHRTLKEKAKRRVANPKDETSFLENREFSYRQLKCITNNFSQEIGKGGFGAVYLGYLENGNPVAVKLRSESSSQGGKEFLAEAQHLTRIHHKNLVSLIGYCNDKNHLALVYEYMPEGNLQDHLRDTSTSKPLTWEQRLQIALDSAQGLEYLHVACKPALIHRDVKSRNILLTTDLSAKIADFGLTKAFSDSKTHITTEPAGTMGYLDPEYYRSYHISEKSDVYSFGVVLLELITGHPPVVPINDSVSIHIGEWVHQNLDQGSIEGIVDSTMGGDYDINSIWKVANLALHCKQEISRERPTMTDVVAQIKESMELEACRDRKRNSAVAGDDLSYGSEVSALEVEGSVGEISEASPGPAMR